ncbi:WD repeat-containing protein 18 [Lucilia sericata]|uniref:WD repeat-containing protein 18 n=1 Tax=Lucilia sericata TaxID=13632 RepID=UPI0018A8673B|nr:WD repeat-containing protein 18 [Lucilia sericata]
MTDNNILEVLFVSDTNDHQLSCSVWDYRTGTNLMNYKGGGGGAAMHSLNLLRSEYVVAANLTKPLLHVWPINNQEQMTAIRFVVPGAVTALALSPDGCYIVAGIQETIYIWQLSTGRMMASLGKHYQTVTCLKFTDDGSHFVSAGKDGAVLVWNLTQVLCRNIDGSSEPTYTFNDHGLPVTDVHIGAGGIRSYMFTVSLDRSCKIYDLNSGTMLLSVVFAEGLQSVITNAMETLVFVGTNTGNIFQFYINDIPRVKEYHVEEQPKSFLGHTKGSCVNCLALSLDGQTLVSGASDNQVLVWNIPSRQLVKTMQFKGPITNLKIRLTNPVVFHPEHKQPQVFCSNLKRMLDPIEQDEEQAIEVMVSNSYEDEYESDEYKYANRHLDYSSSCSNMLPAVTNNTAAENSEELEALRQEVQKLRRVNKRLFEVSSKQLLRMKK